MFSRKQVMQFRSLDLNECLTNCIAMTERLMGEHIQVEFHPGDDLPAIHGDSTMIQQVVMNLSVNGPATPCPPGGQVKIATAKVLIQRARHPDGS